MLEKFKSLPKSLKIIIVIAAITIWPLTFMAAVCYFTYLGIRKTIKLIKEKKYLKALPLGIFSAIFAFALVTSFFDAFFNTSTPSNSTPDTSATIETKLPAYTVNSVDDTSVGSTVRKTLNIVVTDTEYTLDDLYNIAEKEIKSYINSTKINAITAGFYNSADHIGKGYDMGRVEYVPNGNFADAVKVKTGDYSSFKFVNYLSEPLKLTSGEELQDGTSNLETIKNDFAKIYSDASVTAEIKDSTLYITSTEAEDHPFAAADENAIACYTDFSLDNIMGDIKYLDITVIRPSSRVHAALDMSKMSTDNGRYFDSNYIRANIK